MSEHSTKPLLFSVAKLAVCFFFYALIGWCYEMFCLWEAGLEWTDRSFLYGPFCPIYAFGALLFVAAFWALTHRKKPLWLRILCPFIVFLGCALIASTLELVSSYILEAAGAWPLWDYSNEPIHFQARIALIPAIRFGIGGVLALYLSQPAFNFVLNRLPKWLVYLLGSCSVLFFVINFLLTILL